MNAGGNGEKTNGKLNNEAYLSFLNAKPAFACPLHFKELAERQKCDVKGCRETAKAYAEVLGYAEHIGLPLPVKLREIAAQHNNRYVFFRGKIVSQTKRRQVMLPKLQMKCAACEEIYPNISPNGITLLDCIEQAHTGQDVLRWLKSLAPKLCASCKKAALKIKEDELRHIDVLPMYLSPLIEEETPEESAGTTKEYVPCYYLPKNGESINAKTAVFYGRVRLCGKSLKSPIIFSEEMTPLEDGPDTYKPSPEEVQELKDHFNATNEEEMEALYKILCASVAPAIVRRDRLKFLGLLCAHSALYLPGQNGKSEFGLIDVLTAGDGGGGKSDIIKDVVSLCPPAYSERVVGESAKRTGLTYSAEKAEGENRRITWGAIVQADRGLCGLEGMQGFGEAEIMQLREMRTDKKVCVRLSVSGEAWARTRILGSMNLNRPMNEYPSGFEAIMQGHEILRDFADRRRWDWIVCINGGDVSDEDKINAQSAEDLGKTKPEIPRECMKRSITLAWGTKPANLHLPEAVIKKLSVSAKRIMRKYPGAYVLQPDYYKVLKRGLVALIILTKNTALEAGEREEVFLKLLSWFVAWVDSFYTENWELDRYVEARKMQRTDLSEVHKKLLGRGNAIRIIAELARSPGLQQSVIAQKLNMKRPNVNTEITWLEGQGLAVKKKMELTSDGVKVYRENPSLFKGTDASPEQETLQVEEIPMGGGGA